jgi:hypothetical protein
VDDDDGESVGTKGKTKDFGLAILHLFSLSLLSVPLFLSL